MRREKQGQSVIRDGDPSAWAARRIRPMNLGLPLIRYMQGTMIKRIAKMIAVLGTNMGLNLVVQLLLPPAFLHYYGIKRYGEWLVLQPRSAI